jgi:hypothetical protein
MRVVGKARPTAACGSLEMLPAKPTLASACQRPFALVVWAAAVLLLSFAVRRSLTY